MSEQVNNAAVEEELVSLRAEVTRLRRALEQHQTRTPPVRQGLFETNPELPGLKGLWRGERGIGWQLFVQGVVAVQAVLAVLAGITIVH